MDSARDFLFQKTMTYLGFLRQLCCLAICVHRQKKTFLAGHNHMDAQSEQQSFEEVSDIF